MRNIKLLLFDFDFTLVDSWQAMVKIREALKEKHGLINDGRSEKEAWGATIAQNAAWMKEMNETELKVEEIEQLVIDYSLEYYPDLVIDHQGALKTWHRSGKVLGIVTAGNSTTIRKVLENPRNKELNFDLILHSDSTRDKADCIEEALKKMGIAKSETIYIGDHINDILAAKKAGVTACAVTTGFFKKRELAKHRPDMIIENLSGLSEIIK